MTGPLTRRGLTIGMSTLLAAATAPARAIAENPIETIERRHGGRLGVFALDTGSGRTLAHRADERFLLCSTFKGMLAAAVLAQVDAGRERLANRVPYGAADLLPHSPVTSAHVKRGALTIGTLCAAIIEVSDNTAANLLLTRVGGPKRLTAYVRGLGDTVTRFDRTELDLNHWSGVLDTTTPRAIAGSARTVVLGDALAAGSRIRLEGWMATNAVGRSRLRAAFPPGWVAGDKTGTGDYQCNDYAVARRPGRPALVMAAYYETRDLKLTAQEAVLREAGQAIVIWAQSGATRSGR